MIGVTNNKLEKEISQLVRDKYHHQTDKIKLRKDIKRLTQGEPLDYVIGWREFLGCPIDLLKRPLIPRAETEFWVEKAITELKKDKRNNLNYLDIFAGSGCIGIAVLKHCPGIKMTFVEKEKKFVDQIKLNLKLNKILLNRAKIIKSDVFSKITNKYDYIFANPPYVPTKKQKVQKSVKDWEPKIALFAGPSGLKFIKKFLLEAKMYLKPDGRIYLEFGFGQKRLIEKLFKKFGYSSWQFYKDQFGKYRWVVIMENSRS